MIQDIKKTRYSSATKFLFLLQVCETFLSYGIRTLLLLYLVHTLSLNDANAYSLFGAFVGLLWAMPILGVMITEKFLNYITAFKGGAFLMILGCFFLSSGNANLVYIGLSLITFGSGLF